MCIGILSDQPKSCVHALHATAELFFGVDLLRIGKLITTALNLDRMVTARESRPQILYVADGVIHDVGYG